MARIRGNVNHEDQIDEMLARFYADPLGYVMWCFPWTDDPSIQVVKLKEPWASRFKSEFGPDVWACEMLDQLGLDIRQRGFDGQHAVDPIRYTTTSGHGIGKSTIAAWLVKFLMDTRPYCHGTVTANTADQLKTRTWAEVGKWHNLSLTSHRFDYKAGRGSMALTHKVVPEKWFCHAQTCREENSEAFAGQHAANSTSFYIFDEACHDDQTDVMTSAGWKRFKDITAADRLLTPDGWQIPSALHVSHRRGPMKAIEKRGLSMLVTPNHDLLLRSPKSVLWRKKRADQVKSCQEAAPRTVEWTAPEYPVSDDQLRLDAWYYSEGHLLRNTYEPKKNGLGRPALGRKWHGFGITNQDSRGIPELLTRLGVRWSEAPTASTRQWLVYEPTLADRYAEQGHNCREKTIPQWMFSLSRRQMRVFLDTYVEGDGYGKQSGRILYTSSKAMADDLHALAVLAGFNSSLTRRALIGKRTWVKDHWATSACDGYVISLSETGALTFISSASMTDVDYNGMVYCATVPTGLLLTRRNGTVIWSGNSAIPDKIYEVRSGGLTDGEPMTFDFGNPTRNSGTFYQNHQGRTADRYRHFEIDSRTVEITNKTYIDQLIADYGIDSDYVRVRVLGQFPEQGSIQFIGTGYVEDAMAREVNTLNRAAPMVLGVDPARFGDDESVIKPRMGDDARSWPARRFKGLDTVQLTAQVINTVNEFGSVGIRVAAIFVDGVGLGAGVVDQLRHLGYNPIEVQSSGSAVDKKQYRRKGDELWGLMRDHIKARLILPIAGTPEGDDLKTQLTSREYGINDHNQIALESKKVMKERGVPSPDMGDALALTYAAEVAPVHMSGDQAKPAFTHHDYDPFEWVAKEMA